MRPCRRQPTRLLCPWDSPGKNTGVGCHFLLQCVKVKNESEVAQRPTLCDPMDCSLPGSSVHGIFQARVLEWVAMSFSRRPRLKSWVRKIPWRRDRLPTSVFLGFPGGSDCKESTCSARDPGSIPGLGRCRGGGHGNPLQYTCLENPHGQRSLAGYSLCGHKESDTTEVT